MAPPLIVLILAPVESRSLIRTSPKNKLISRYKHFIQKRLLLMLQGWCFFPLQEFYLHLAWIHLLLAFLKYQMSEKYIIHFHILGWLTPNHVLHSFLFCFPHFGITETMLLAEKTAYLLIITISIVVSSGSIIYNKVT